jgi:hypothetical protein
MIPLRYTMLHKALVGVPESTCKSAYTSSTSAALGTTDHRGDDRRRNSRTLQLPQGYVRIYQQTYVNLRTLIHRLALLTLTYPGIHAHTDT